MPQAHPPAAAVVPAPLATAARPKLAKVNVVATVPTNIANMTPAELNSTRVSTLCLRGIVSSTKHAAHSMQAQ